MQIINRDLLTVTDGIIAHGCNAQGVMESGVALLICKEYPSVYESYVKLFKSRDRPNFLRLGEYQLIKVSDSLFVANLITQWFYGAGGKRYVDYAAINSSCCHLAKNKNLGPIHFPYNFGTDRGGGDFNLIKEIVCYHIPDVIFCKI